MKYFFNVHIPPVSRLLLIESCSPDLTSRLVTRIKSAFPDADIELFTYLPLEADPQGNRSLSRISTYEARTFLQRLSLLWKLRRARYDVVGVVCSGEPYLRWWKLCLIAFLPAKVFVANENADIFWLDRAHLNYLRLLVLQRAGVPAGGAIQSLWTLLALPFCSIYLVLYATFVHLRRYLANACHRCV